MLYLRYFKKRFCQINPDHLDHKGPPDYPPLSMDLRICADTNSFTLPTFEENDKKNFARVGESVNGTADEILFLFKA